MKYERTTQVPNIIFDNYLPDLSLSELKLLLVIIRQTYGWIDQTTRARKERDRISHSQFMTKTGLSRRIISATIQILLSKKLIVIMDSNGKVLHSPKQRKGRLYLYYSFIPQPMQIEAATSAMCIPTPVQKSVHNKTNYIKLTDTKVLQNIESIQEIIECIKENIRKNIS